MYVAVTKEMLRAGAHYLMRSEDLSEIEATLLVRGVLRHALKGEVRFIDTWNPKECLARFSESLYNTDPAVFYTSREVEGE